MLARAGVFLRGQLVQYGLNHRLYVRPAGVDDEVGDLAVQRIAFRPELLEFAARVGGLQQRAVLVMRGALQDITLNVDLGERSYPIDARR
jgi:hypothetical protein